MHFFITKWQSISYRRDSQSLAHQIFREHALDLKFTIGNLSTTPLCFWSWSMNGLRYP